MQRRLFIIIGVLLAIIAVAGLLFVVMQQRNASTPTPAEETAQQAEPTAIPMKEVIVARQPIPRGGEFTAESLGRTEYPESSIPPNAIVNEAETIGKIANSEIVQGQIIVRDLLRDKVGGGGSGEAAFDIPAGHVMVAFPIDKQTSVAYAIQPGDVVDVLMTFSIVDLDPEFQTILPNKFSFLLQDTQTSSGGEQSTSISLSPAIDKGRLNIENEMFPGFEFPREDQRPRRVAQLTVQRAKVIKVGTFLETEETNPQPVAEGEPTPTPTRPDIASLAVTPQDALVLLWARQSKAYMELALRAAGDEQADHSTEAVTLQYMLTRFNIAVPPKLEFGIDKSENLPTEQQAVSAPQPTNQQ